MEGCCSSPRASTCHSNDCLGGAHPCQLIHLCSLPSARPPLLANLFCRYLLAGEQLDTTTTWGPPRLATIAAAVLHKSLVTDLGNIRELEKAEQAAAQQAADGSKTSATTGKVTVRLDVDAILADCCSPYAEAQSAAQPEQQDQQRPSASPSQQNQQSGEPSGQGPAGSDHNAAGGTQKRRWSLTAQHRRSVSGGRGSCRGGAAEPGGSRPPSRRSLASRAHSRRGSRGQGEFGPPPSPLSPRMLMSVVLGGGGTSQEQQGHTQDDKGIDKDVESVPVTPKSHTVFPDLALLMSPSGIAALRDRWEGQQQVQLDLDPLQQLPDSLAGCDSGSFCSLVVGDDYSQGAYWDDDLAEPVPAILPIAPGQAGDVFGQQQHQEQASTSSTGSAEPQLASSSMLDCLFNQYTWSSCVKAETCHVRDDNLGEDSRTCGICLDEVPTARIVPCNHSMCGEWLLRTTIQERVKHNSLQSRRYQTAQLWQQQCSVQLFLRIHHFALYPGTPLTLRLARCGVSTYSAEQASCLTSYMLLPACLPACVLQLAVHKI